MLIKYSMAYMFNPRCMHKGYGSHSVCECMSVCVSVTTLVATYLICMSKVGIIGFLAGLYCLDFAENICLGDMA